jgi:HD-GYP domain-containing protein (c-di-GMP phosphodiesterase class II)
VIQGTIEVLSGFRRKLAFRLLAVGIIAAVLSGIAAYFIETERLDDSLVDRSVVEANILSGFLTQNQSPQLKKQQLAGFLQQHAGMNLDYFVSAELYDTQRHSVGNAALSNFSYIDAAIDSSALNFPSPGHVWYDKTVIHGIPFLHIIMPLSGSHGGAQVGWFEGVFRLSPQTLSAVRNDVLQIMALVMGAVLLTVATLYPLMSSLQGLIVATVKQLLRANIDTLKVLGNAIAKRDNDTNAHNFRVTLYAVRIAEALEISDADIRDLIKGAFLHDVGKIAVADAILRKPGKLDQAEFSEMQTHVQHGLDIIAANHWLSNAAAVVGGHHEKVDGSGYPRGLRGQEIPLSARIFAVADVFDALTSARPYKKPWTLDEALQALEQGRGGHFDPQVLDAFNTLSAELYQSIRLRSEEQVTLMMDDVIMTYYWI